AEDGIRDFHVTGVQTCALPIFNGILTNIPSAKLRPGDVVSVRGKSQGMETIVESVNNKSDVRKYPWLEFNKDKMEGTYITVPQRDHIPENINEQLIVELYSK